MILLMVLVERKCTHGVKLNVEYEPESLTPELFSEATTDPHITPPILVIVEASLYRAVNSNSKSPPTLSTNSFHVSERCPTGGAVISSESRSRLRTTPFISP